VRREDGGGMKALVYLGPGRMELQDAPDPTPGPGEVVIASRASAICGSDLHGFREASPRRIPPLVMGHETVGEIAEVGDGVPDSRIGERVVLKPIVSCGTCASCREGAINHCASGRLVGRDLPGGFAERFAVPASAAVRFDADVTAEVATLTEPLANAVHVAARAVREGDRVFVIGAGPIGVLMAKAALLYGATRVLVTDPLAERLLLAEAQGAETVTRDDPVRAVLDATDGEGADLVIDAAGFEATWAMGLKAVRARGRIYEVGLGAGSGTVDFFAVLGKEATITGSYAWGDDDFARALELLAQGALDPTGWITTMPLADGQRAFQELVDGAGRFKVVLVP
jgi:2-desacetyl-2-hydroxyethyl bacteriochlorophyllide A dehydrogenase